MSEAATPAVAAGNRVSTTRIVGGAGVALAASVAVQNAVFVGTGAPAFGDPLGEVLAYHAENRGAVAVAVGQEAVNLPLLLLFVTGLHGLVQRRGGAGADWSRLAVAAGATLSAGIGPRPPPPLTGGISASSSPGPSTCSAGAYSRFTAITSGRPAARSPSAVSASP